MEVSHTLFRASFFISYFLFLGTCLRVIISLYACRIPRETILNEPRDMKQWLSAKTLCRLSWHSSLPPVISTLHSSRGLYGVLNSNSYSLHDPNETFFFFFYYYYFCFLIIIIMMFQWGLSFKFQEPDYTTGVKILISVMYELGVAWNGNCI